MCDIKSVMRSTNSRSKILVFSLILAAVIIVSSTTFYLLAFGAGSHLAVRTKAALFIAVVGVIELLALWAILYGLRRHGKSLTEIGWRKPTSPLVIALAIIGATIYILLALTSPSLHISNHIKEIGPLKIWGASVGLLAAFVEEIIFRGYLITELQRKGFSTQKQVITSGLVFGLAHLSFSPIGVLYASALGIFLGFIYIVGRRSLTAPIICHGIINIALEPWLILGVLNLFSAK